MAKIRWWILLCTVLLGSPIDAKKDVWFIAVDDLRPELSFYGSKTAKTPNMDTLAAMCMIFERAYCQVAGLLSLQSLTPYQQETRHQPRVEDFRGRVLAHVHQCHYHPSVLQGEWVSIHRHGEDIPPREAWW